MLLDECTLRGNVKLDECTLCGNVVRWMYSLGEMSRNITPIEICKCFGNIQNTVQAKYIYIFFLIQMHNKLV